MTPVRTISIEEPKFNIKEIKRYSHYGEADDSLLDSCLEELKGITYRVSYAEFDITEKDGGLDLEFAFTDSKNLQTNLKNCEKIILFAATVGFAPDRLIEKYNRISPAKALMFQAIGSERAESLCDAFNEMIRAEYDAKGYKLHPRFSPGYGDLPITMQRDIMRVLDCRKNLGIILNENCLMMPSKSVTAIIGTEKKES